jgi:hypothetical protein
VGVLDTSGGQTSGLGEGEVWNFGEPSWVADVYSIYIYVYNLYVCHVYYIYMYYCVQYIYTYINAYVSLFGGSPQ